MTWKIRLAGVLSAAALVGCSSSSSGDAPLVASLALSSSAASVAGDGSTVQIIGLAVDAQGKQGTGQLVLQAPAGDFGGNGKTATLTLANGGASVAYSCNVSVDPACTGQQIITGAWSGQSGSVRVTVSAVTGPGTPDAGSGSGGTPDAGTGNGTDAGVVAGPAASIAFSVQADTKDVLGVHFSGRDVATPVYFLVTDASGLPVPNVAVDFSVNGPGAVKLVPAQSTTDANGLARTVLYSGDIVGVASVTASVADAISDPNVPANSTPRVKASSPGTSIVGAVPSDRGFVVQCEKVNLGANESVTPPRTDLSTACAAKLVDAAGNPVGIATQVNWFAEAGSMNQVVLSTPQTDLSATTSTGIATSDFSTAGVWPPLDVAPMPGEITNGSKNQRDMLVTVISVVEGEEQYWDGSGTGTLNGKYDPGEWFVDVGEPFVDLNDNNQWDPGEPFIDTTWYKCDGTMVPPNGQYDGPNGCWDGPGNGRHPIQLWRATHLVYSGVPSQLAYGPTPVSVPEGAGSNPGSFDVSFSIADDYGNPLDPDGASIGVALSPALTGAGASITDLDPRLTARAYPFDISEDTVELNGTTGSVVGPCDPSKTTSQDGKFRCVRRFSFSNFVSGNPGVITLTNANTSGIAAGSTSVVVTGQNAHGAAKMAFPATFQ